MRPSAASRLLELLQAGHEAFLEQFSGGGYGGDFLMVIVQAGEDQISVREKIELDVEHAGDQAH
jgi:hypothetical protein